MSAAALATPALRTEPARPLLSLCLATYNRARYLDRYLTHHLTAFDQAGLDYELTVSDNCSTDETPEILARYAARFPRLRVVRQASNIGVYGNIFHTVQHARGEVIVSIADDDMLVPHNALRYVETLAGDPALVMIQSPWFMLDETQNDAVIGKFYDFPAPVRFGKDHFSQCLQFLLSHHVFPECWITKRSVIREVFAMPNSFAFSFFTMLGRALHAGDVLFTPEPHAMVTAIAKGANQHAGNGEAMQSWDCYRGGLEVFASYARLFEPGVTIEPASLASALQSFTMLRMQVAARLHAGARNWSNAWHLDRRLLAFGFDQPIGVERADLGKLAAIETAITETAVLGARTMIVDDRVVDTLLGMLKLPEGIALARMDAPEPADGQRGILWLGEPPVGVVRSDDVVCDLFAVLNRFPS